MTPYYYLLRFLKILLGLATKQATKQATNVAKKKAPGLIKAYLDWSRKLYRKRPKRRKRN